MKKTLLIACILLLAFTVSNSVAQMGGGMRDGGMRDGGMMGGEQGQTMEPGQGERQIPQTAGGKIFGENCASCHPDGGNIIVPGLPLRGSRVLTNFRTFEAFIRNPKMPDGSQGSMPSFDRSQISEGQARELYHFVASTEGSALRGGVGMGPGRMRGYGTGPEMMGGYDMGPGMIGYYSQSQECQKFYDDTAKLRKELHDKRFEYFEVMRNPKSKGETAMKLDREIRELQEKIYSSAPLGCQW